MNTTATTWATALLLAIGMASAYMLDGPDDLDAMQDVAADVQAAQAQAAAQRLATVRRTQPGHQQ